MREAIMGRKCLFSWCKVQALNMFLRKRARLWLWTVGLPSTRDTSKHYLNYSVCRKHFLERERERERESCDKWRMVDFVLLTTNPSCVLRVMRYPQDFSIPSEVCV